MANKPTKRPGTGSSSRVTPPSTASKTSAAPPTKAAARKAAADKDQASKEHLRTASRSGNPRTAAKATASSRYTAPLPRSAKVSPRWVPIVMFGLLGLGMLLIFFNYIGFPFGDPSNWRLIIGLALILGGIVTATQYH